MCLTVKYTDFEDTVQYKKNLNYLVNLYIDENIFYIDHTMYYVLRSYKITSFSSLLQLCEVSSAPLL